MTRLIFTLTILFLSACSTVERETFYTPSSKFGAQAPLPRLYCGMSQSNTLANEFNYNGLIYNAHQSTEPYLWGPWLITVVPIFPITWVVDLFSSSELELLVHATNNSESPPQISQLEIAATLENGESKTVSPKNISNLNGFFHLVYPIKTSSVVSFSLKAPDGANTITFTKGSRWSWVQYCIN